MDVILAYSGSKNKVHSMVGHMSVEEHSWNKKGAHIGMYNNTVWNGNSPVIQLCSVDLGLGWLG